jgi:uncharacterized DUF497 family protein
VTIGLDRTGVLRVVVHTFEHVGEGQFEIRFISARKATSREIDQYQDRRI